MKQHSTSQHCLPEGTRIYAIGDIHGQLELLTELHALIRADMSGSDDVPASIKIVYLGDYIDRGIESAEVVDLLIHHPIEGAESIFLLGNHEHALIEFLAGRMRYPDWVLWGGDSTIASYGATLVPPFAEDSKVDELRKELAEVIPATHYAFFQQLKLMHEEGDYLFVHAGIRPNVALDKQNLQDLLMIREEFLNRPVTCGKTVVHGHTIFEEPNVRDGSIGIDTGAFATGKLTAVVLENDRFRFITTQ